MTIKLSEAHLISVLQDFFAKPAKRVLKKALGAPKAEAVLYALKYGVRDELTGLHLRHWLDEVWPRETRRAARFSHPLSIALIDVNYLKLVNDTRGYGAGDKLLAKLAEILSKEARATDCVLRWGGDEFLVVFPETDSAGAEVYMRRVSQRLLRLPAKETFSISFGIGEWTMQDEEWPEGKPFKAVLEEVNCQLREKRAER